MRKKRKTDYTKLRQRMVEEQLIPRGIKDKKVLTAFLKVEREKFIPADMREEAYEDFPLPIGEEQTISQPYMVALMTQCLELRGDEKVLELGTGSGYQTAILAELAKEVYSLERIEKLAQRARRVLCRLGYANVQIFVINGTMGYEEFSPYDRILVTAGAKEIPPPLIEQLKDGGIMVIPVGDTYSHELKVVRKQRDIIKSKMVERCVFVPLIGEYGWDKNVKK